MLCVQKLINWSCSQQTLSDFHYQNISFLFKRSVYYWYPLFFSLWNKICNHVLHVSWKPPFAETCDHLLFSRKHPALLNQCISSTLLVLESSLITWFKILTMLRVFSGTLEQQSDAIFTCYINWFNTDHFILSYICLFSI